MVGVEGFEPPTTCTQNRCATKLRYTPISGVLYRAALALSTDKALFLSKRYISLQKVCLFAQTNRRGAVLQAADAIFIADF